MKDIISACLILLMSCGSVAAQRGEPLQAWRSHPEIRPVLDVESSFHSIHTYYTTCPESPDGRQVLFFRSKTPDAHLGDVCVLDRKTKDVQVLANNIETEDAHRAACQQWVLDGRVVVFHEFREARWRVVTVEVESGERRELAVDRQVGFCQSHSNVVPLYGPHGDPGDHPHLELLDVRTGDIVTAVAVDSVRPAWAETGYARYFDQQFGDRSVSICFPMISPDGKGVFFKLATPGSSRDFRSSRYSRRLGILFYDLTSKRYLTLHPKWGHPAWHPDSRRIINMWSDGPVQFNAQSGTVEERLAMPDYMRSGGHPSMSPGGDLFVTDGRISGSKSDWGVALGSFAGNEWHLLMKFDNSKGAVSWRRNHPHPVFSKDGKRLYFNVNSNRWTRLHVAEVGLTRADGTVNHPQKN